MWISNTASTVVMLPIAISVIKLLIDDEDGFTKGDRNFALSVMLGIAFSANAGGIATVIGTPPNSVLIGLLENDYNMEVSFVKWMVIGLPFSILMVSLCYLVLVKWMFPCNNIQFTTSANVITEELQKLGQISNKELRVLIIFALMVLLWITRTLINHLVPGLHLTDTIISLVGAISLFVIPMNINKASFVLEWKDTSKLAWGILLLFGGGLALANGMKESGLVTVVTDYIQNGGFSPWIVVSLLIVLMLFMTELMSNVALVAVLAPLIAGIAPGLGIPLLNVLIPVTMASSCAFMLPMATPPNAIVFASGYVKVNQMARAGIILNILAVVLLILYYLFVIPKVFG
jgi:sodium-dependent dicarboxylate transporter 2/3/5